MAKFKMNYRAEDELSPGASILTPGLGTFELKRIYDVDKEGKPLQTSKGDAKINLQFIVTDCNGNQSTVYESISANNVWRAYTIVKACGRKELYTPDGVDFDQIIGIQGQCKIGTQSTPGYNDKSVITSFLEMKAPVRADEQLVADNTFTEDDLPF